MCDCDYHVLQKFKIQYGLIFDSVNLPEDTPNATHVGRIEAKKISWKALGSVLFVKMGEIQL